MSEDPAERTFYLRPDDSMVITFELDTTGEVIASPEGRDRLREAAVRSLEKAIANVVVQG